jgi:putative DNA primase/helicase
MNAQTGGSDRPNPHRLSRRKFTVRDLASPVCAFVRERCITGASHQIRTDDLYAAYKRWAEDAGHSRKSKPTFGRDLRAAVPAIDVQRPRYQPDRHRLYVGIDLDTAETEVGQ